MRILTRLKLPFLAAPVCAPPGGVRAMKHLLRSSALVVILAAGWNTRAQPKWQVYTAANKSFSVELPTKPIYKRRRLASYVGLSRDRYFKGSSYEEFYDLNIYRSDSFTRFSISVFEVAETRSEREFAEEADSIIAAVGGESMRLLKNDSVRVNGLQGREYVYEKGKASSRVLMVNGGKRIYILRFFTDDEKGIHREPVERIFNTFQPTP